MRRDSKSGISSKGSPAAGTRSNASHSSASSASFASVFPASPLDTAGRVEAGLSHRKHSVTKVTTRHHKKLARIAFFLLIFALPARAHVGSPDVFLDANAGPYRLFVTVRVPQVIPGIAQIEIRSASNDVREIKIAPMQLTGPGSQYAPTPDVAERSKTDPQFFTGSLWLMELGSLQVRVDVDGAKGQGELAVPVPAVAQRTLPMQKPLGTLAVRVDGAARLRAGFHLCRCRSRRRCRPRRRRSRLQDPPRARRHSDRSDRRGRYPFHRRRMVEIRCRAIRPPRLYAPAIGRHASARRHPASAPEAHQLAAATRAAPRTSINFDNLILDHGHLMHFFMIRMPADGQLLAPASQPVRPGDFHYRHAADARRPL